MPVHASERTSIAAWRVSVLRERGISGNDSDRRAPAPRRSDRRRDTGRGIVARAFDLATCLRLENLSRLTEAIEGHGVLGPVIYIAPYVLGVLFFVPRLPMTLLGGLAFRPVRGAWPISVRCPASRLELHEIVGAAARR